MTAGDTYRALHARSLDDPDGFWAEQAGASSTGRSAGTRCSMPRNRHSIAWFIGGAVECLPQRARPSRRRRARRPGGADLQFAGHRTPRRPSPIASCAIEVATIAGAIAAQGVKKGDRVIVYMPMIPEAAMAMLACARLGAIHSVVFGGFAANELATRIDDSQPKLVLTASCGIEPGRIVQYKPLLDQAIEMANHKVPKVILFQRPQCVGADEAGPRPRLGRDGEAGHAACVRAGRGDASALHPLYVGHDRPAQGRGARHRRLLRGALTGR